MLDEIKLIGWINSQRFSILNDFASSEKENVFIAAGVCRFVAVLLIEFSKGSFNKEEIPESPKTEYSEFNPSANSEISTDAELLKDHTEKCNTGKV